MTQLLLLGCHLVKTLDIQLIIWLLLVVVVVLGQQIVVAVQAVAQVVY
jgi:hypothetical protein